MAASVIVTIALRVRVVKMIVRFSYVHCESAETPLSGIGGECKLDESKNQHWECKGIESDGITLSAIEGALGKEVAREHSRRGGGGIKKLTGDRLGEEGPDERPALGRRVVDELAISGL